MLLPGYHDVTPWLPWCFFLVTMKLLPGYHNTCLDWISCGNYKLLRRRRKWNIYRWNFVLKKRWTFRNIVHSLKNGYTHYNRKLLLITKIVKTWKFLLVKIKKHFDKCFCIWFFKWLKLFIISEIKTRILSCKNIVLSK